MNELNKDFYEDLPGMICVQLDDIFIKNLSGKDGFEEAWEEYRQHIKTSSMDDMKMPYSVFKKYFTEDEMRGNK